ncbi:hypothetical protein AR456_14585 [Halomonas huangheensis]|nr:hypothetical protein AR456_14585 [Halomonas huangheensis]
MPGRLNAKLSLQLLIQISNSDRCHASLSYMNSIDINAITDINAIAKSCPTPTQIKPLPLDTSHLP